MLDSEVYQMLSERLSHEGGEEHIDGLLESYRTALLLLMFIECSYLLKDLYSVLLRHLEVQQHEAYRSNSTVVRCRHHRLFDDPGGLVDYILTMHAVSALLLHT